MSLCSYCGNKLGKTSVKDPWGGITWYGFTCGAMYCSFGCWLRGNYLFNIIVGGIITSLIFYLFFFSAYLRPTFDDPLTIFLILVWCIVAIGLLFLGIIGMRLRKADGY
ncbi:MAG: hypothetical protein ACFFAJ_01725 [Candidatus Hodarchaeota archaeon]